jgi:radical SAM superfamily enzyme YgiQ (UPF0313 family)
MRILFVNSCLGGDYSALDIAITALATYVNERTQHKSTICDLTFHRRHWKKHLKKQIEKDMPDIIGISANTLYMQYVRQIMREVKLSYKIPIILGGYHASINPDDCINIAETDMVCIGDGEYILQEILDNLQAGKGIEGIKGLWVKRDGKITKNEGGCFIENIDNLPMPNWDLWEDLDLYFYFLGMLYIIGSRGCPYRCTYCDAHGISQAVNGQYYRIRNPRQYAQEIACHWNKYKNRGVRLAQLFDQVFTFDEKWVTEFCDEYRKQGIADKFRFSTFSRIDNLNEKKILELSHSGCALLRVGIEAGDTKIRNEIYKKNISNDKIREIFRLCKQNSIGFTAFYMLGGPGEDRSTIEKTISFARELDANRSAFFVYKPFTLEGLKQVVEHGGIVDENLWKKADNITFDAVIKLKDLSPGQIEWLQKKAYFFTFGKRLLRMILRQTLMYFVRLFIYMAKGAKYGLDKRYCLIYYHIYGYDNVDK